MRKNKFSIAFVIGGALIFLFVIAIHVTNGISRDDLNIDNKIGSIPSSISGLEETQENVTKITEKKVEPEPEEHQNSTEEVVEEIKNEKIERVKDEKKKENNIDNIKETITKQISEDKKVESPKAKIEQKKSDNNDIDKVDGKKVQEYIDNSKIISPKEKEVVADELKIVVEAEEATKVESYTRRQNANQKNYLGNLIKKENNKWVLVVQTGEKLPNGEYSLFVKVKNKYGEYNVGPVAFAVSRIVEVAQENNPVKMTDATTMQNTNVVNNTKNLQKKVISNDSDGDGLSDEEEKRLGTDSNNPDSDGDGFLDGDEIKNGYNPLKFSPGDKSDKMIFQDPREHGNKNEEFAVHNVELIQEQQNNQVPQQQIQNTLRLSGTAIPNSYVNIYIYSTAPVIVTVRTDDNGNWSYDLDKHLDNGKHEAYVVLTDNTGKITAKSAPFNFIKTAQAATPIDEVQARAQLAQSPAQTTKSMSLVYWIVLIVAFIAIALMVLGVVANHNAHKEK